MIDGGCDGHLVAHVVGRFGPVHWTTRVGYDGNKAVVDYNSYKRYSIDVAFPVEFVLPVFGEPHQFVFAPTAGFSRANYSTGS